MLPVLVAENTVLIQELQPQKLWIKNNRVRVTRTLWVNLLSWLYSLEIRMFRKYESGISIVHTRDRRPQPESTRGRDGKLKIMPEFVIEREVPGAGALSESEIRDLSIRSLQVLKELGPQIQWLHSYVTEDKVYCVYLAPDENSIREHARRVGLPADRVSAVRRLISPANPAGLK